MAFKLIIPRFIPLSRPGVVRLRNPYIPTIVSAVKCFSTTFPPCNAGTDPSLDFSPSATPSQIRNGKWLSTVKTRVGKLVFHGLKNEETSEAADILQDLSRNWREYVASSQGFLTGEHRRGLYRHSVVWGDMVGSSLGVICFDLYICHSDTID